MPAGAGGRLDVAVGSKDASTGGFEITQSDLAVVPLLVDDSGGDLASGTIDEPGSLVVYSIDVAEPLDGSGSSIEILVNSFVEPDPNRKPGEKEDPGLDVEIEVIDPTGTGVIADSTGPGRTERTTLSGGIGQYLVVVRGDGDSTGAFELTASPVTYETLSFDEAADAEVESADVPAAFAVSVPAGSEVEVTVTPVDPDLDLVFEVVDPSGTSSSIDSTGSGEAEVAVLTGEGQHFVRVNEYTGSPGSFALTASRVTSTTLLLDEPVDAEVESADAPRAFSIDVPADSYVGVAVTPTGDLDPELEVVDPYGTSYPADSAGSGEAEVAALTSGPGQYQVRVRGYEGSVGSFAIVAASLNTAGLEEDAPSTATAPVAFGVEVEPGDLLSFDAESEDPESVLNIQVVDPDGSQTGGVSLDAGAPATVLLDGAVPGFYSIIVGSTEPDTDIIATIRRVESVDLLEDEPVTVAAPAAFDVDVIEGQTLTFTAQPDAEDSFLDVSVQDADGNETGSARAPEAGEPATVSLGGGFPGRYRIVVSYSGAPTDVTATLQAADTEPLALGSAPVDGVAPAIFDIDLAAGERRLVIVTPLGDDSLSLTISSPDSDAPALVDAPDLGEPTVALLTGEGTHQVSVESFGGGDGLFSIEIQDVAGGP